MRHKSPLLWVTLALLWVASAGGATDTALARPVTPTTTTAHWQETTSKPQTTLLPLWAATARNVLNNPEGSEAPSGREVAFGAKTEEEPSVPRGSAAGNPAILSSTTREESSYECECGSLWACECTEPKGKVVNQFGYQDETTWTFNIDGIPVDSPILVQVYFYAEDLPSSNTAWLVKIGQSTNFTRYSELHNKTYVYIRSNEEIYIDQAANFNIVLYYEALALVHVEEAIGGNDTSGVIRFPTNSSEDADLGYTQQLRHLWTFDYPDNYIVELNFTKFDLGYRQADLHWVETYFDKTENDFLLVGLGTEIMESTDKALYGHLDEVKTIRINHPSAHIVMFSSYHEQYAGGFEITYTALEVSTSSTTTTMATTTQAPQLGVIPSTLAPINGALAGNYSALRASFRTAVAGMATEYGSSHGLDVEAPTAIEPSDVGVHWVATCLLETCDEDCAAFNFSIYKMNREGSAWAFTAGTLDLMIRDKELQHYWTTINADCQFCEESVTLNWYVFGGVAGGAVLLAVLISLVVWKIRNITAAIKSKQVIENDLKQEELERRRRSSGDESVIGGVKGGTRMSLPFGTARGSVTSAHSSLDDEAEDYPEHDPDFGYDAFGLGADLLTDNRARKFYSNAAFEPDSPPSGHIGYKQLQQAALQVDPQPSTSSQGLPLKPIPILKSSLKKRRSSQESDDAPTSLNVALKTTPKKVITIVEEEDEDSFTDSDGSDGTVQFRSAALGPRKQISIQADVHHSGASGFGETVL